MSDNPEIVSFPFHLGGPGILTADKQFSIHVSRTLDCLGKNQDMVKYRQNKWRDWQEHNNIIYRPFEIITAGSKAEGLTSMYESDRDSMFVFTGVICADNVRPFIDNRNTTVFQTDRHDSHAGYTKLKLVKYEGPMSNSLINPYSSSVIKYSLLDNESDDKYLSSDLLITALAQKSLEINNTGSGNLHERSGPSLPVSNQEGNLHEDKVHSLICVCPTLLQSFLTRPRPYNRPSCNELHDISVMAAHVVPVGHKGSNESHLEWRICFTKAEIYLVQKLNKTETKLYILLKMVSKLLKCISKDITSYVMKNIVLWLVETYPLDLFTEELLTYQLIQALRFLQKCVKVSYLPSYMIPERNLFSLRLNPVQKLQLTTFLSTLIQERGYLLMRCEKLRYGMTILYREPDMAEEFRRRRDMAEKLYLLYLLRDKIMIEKMAATGLSADLVKRLRATDGTLDLILTAQFVNVLPDLIFLIRQGCSDEAIIKIILKRLVQLMS